MNTFTLSPKASEKQNAIMAAAINVFSIEGFRSTDVQVIADQAGVGKGTVYRYFGNKESLFLATAKFCFEKLCEHVACQISEYPTPEAFMEAKGAAELLRRIASAVAQFYQDNPSYLEILIKENLEFRNVSHTSHAIFRADMRVGLDKLIEAGIHRGDFRNGDAKTLANAFADLVYGSLINGALEGSRSGLVQRVEYAVEMLLNGIVRPSHHLMRSADDGREQAA